jgi:hypothetical protein
MHVCSGNNHLWIVTQNFLQVVMESTSLSKEVYLHHILGTGKKNPELGLEVYRFGRYFTFTGNRENDNDVLKGLMNLQSVPEVFEGKRNCSYISIHKERENKS